MINCLFRESVNHFCDEEDTRCLVIPETMKFDKVIPSKLGKGKVLLFVKLKPCVLKGENMHKNVKF